MWNPLLIVPFCSLFVALLGFRRVREHLQKLRGERRKVMLDVVASAFLATLCISAAALGYIVWMYNKDQLLLVDWSCGFVAFVVSAAYFVRSCGRWKKLPSE